jgi:hypothetical protein
MSQFEVNTHSKAGNEIQPKTETSNRKDSFWIYLTTIFQINILTYAFVASSCQRLLCRPVQTEAFLVIQYQSPTQGFLLNTKRFYNFRIWTRSQGVTRKSWGIKSVKWSERGPFQGTIRNMAVFWVTASCSLVEVYRLFRGACFLHHQDVCKFIPDYMARQHRRQPSSYSPLWALSLLLIRLTHTRVRFLITDPWNFSTVSNSLVTAFHLF